MPRMWALKGKTMWGHSEKRAIGTWRTVVSGETKPADLDLGLPSLQNCEKISVCCLSHPASGILLQQPWSAITVLNWLICSDENWDHLLFTSPLSTEKTFVLKQKNNFLKVAQLLNARTVIRTELLLLYPQPLELFPLKDAGYTTKHQNLALTHHWHASERLPRTPL